MPAAAPALRPDAARRLLDIGQRIRDRRKAIGASLLHTAQAAGLSRVTLTRIERGEPSVTIGSYFNAMDALGLLDAIAPTSAQAKGETATPERLAAQPGARIALAHYPHLRALAWHLPEDESLLLEPRAVFDLVERNHRHLRLDELTQAEQELLDRLAQQFGHGVLLV